MLRCISRPRKGPNMQSLVNTYLKSRSFRSVIHPRPPLRFGHNEVENWREQGCRGGISKAVHKGVNIFCLRSTQARMPVLRCRCVGLVLAVFALDVGLDIAF